MNTAWKIFLPPTEMHFFQPCSLLSNIAPLFMIWSLIGMLHALKPFPLACRIPVQLFYQLYDSPEHRVTFISD